MESLYFDYSKSNNKRKALYAALAVIGVVCIVGAIALSTSGSSSLVLQQFQLEEQEFQQFMDLYSKEYSTPEEYVKRFQVYRDNSAFIRIHNSLGEDWTLGVNEFADLSFTEFGSIYLKSKVPTEKLVKKTTTPPPQTLSKDLKLYPSWDWRQWGKVTPVKNQGQCGSCWAFSATGAVESLWAISNHTLISLSEQELVDCSWSYNNTGCLGGWMDNAFDFIQQHGLTAETNYPYTATNNSCNWTLADQSNITRIDGHQDIWQNSSINLEISLLNNPVSVAVQADQKVWQFYKGGVVTKNCGTDLDHGVLVVGYNSVVKKPYYIVKNSWGAKWGEEGYIRIGIQDGPGVCGIQMFPSYPFYLPSNSTNVTKA